MANEAEQISGNAIFNANEEALEGKAGNPGSGSALVSEQPLASQGQQAIPTLSAGISTPQSAALDSLKKKIDIMNMGGVIPIQNQDKEASVQLVPSNSSPSAATSLNISPVGSPSDSLANAQQILVESPAANVPQNVPSVSSPSSANPQINDLITPAFKDPISAASGSLLSQVPAVKSSASGAEIVSQTGDVPSQSHQVPIMTNPDSVTQTTLPSDSTGILSSETLSSEQPNSNSPISAVHFSVAPSAEVTTIASESKVMVNPTEQTLVVDVPLPETGIIMPDFPILNATAAEIPSPELAASGDGQIKDESSTQNLKEQVTAKDLEPQIVAEESGSEKPIPNESLATEEQAPEEPDLEDLLTEDKSDGSNKAGHKDLLAEVSTFPPVEMQTPDESNNTVGNQLLQSLKALPNVVLESDGSLISDQVPPVYENEEDKVPNELGNDGSKWLHFTRVKDGLGGGKQIVNLFKSIKDMDGFNDQIEELIGVIRELRDKPDLEVKSSGVSLEELLSMLGEFRNHIKTLVVDYDPRINHVVVTILEKKVTTTTTEATKGEAGLTPGADSGSSGIGEHSQDDQLTESPLALLTSNVAFGAPVTTTEVPTTTTPELDRPHISFSIKPAE